MSGGRTGELGGYNQWVVAEQGNWEVTTSEWWQNRGTGRLQPVSGGRTGELGGYNQ